MFEAPTPWTPHPHVPKPKRGMQMVFVVQHTPGEANGDPPSDEESDVESWANRRDKEILPNLQNYAVVFSLVPLHSLLRSSVG